MQGRGLRRQYPSFAASPVRRAVIAVIPDHLFAPVRDMGAHGSQPFHGGKDLACLFVLGRIDDLPFLFQILHPFLGEGGPDDVARQVFHGRIITGRYAVAAEDVEPRMLPSGEHPDHLLGNFSLGKKHPEHLVPKNGFQLLQLQRRGDAEHAFVAIETAISDEDVGVGIVSQEIAKRLHGDDGAGNGIIFGNRLLEKDLQGFPGTAAQIGKKLPVVQEISAQNLRDAEDKMAMGDLFEDIHAQPFSEFQHALLMTGRTEMAAFTGKCQQVFMAAVFTLHTGKAVVQVAAIKITVNHLLDIWPPETVLPGELFFVNPDKGLKIILYAVVIIG